MTDAFLHEAGVQRAALGAERLEPVVIAHPLSTLTADEIAARAAAAAAGVRRVLTAQEPGPGLSARGEKPRVAPRRAARPADKT